MKKILFIATAWAVLSFIPVNNTITQKERDDAAKLLQDTRDGVLNSVKGLNEAQLKFIPGEEKWGVEDCIKHIAASEVSLWQAVENSLEQPANPEKRAEIKSTDAEVIKNIEDRTTRFKTFPNLEPQNIKYKTTGEALQAFTVARQKLIEFVQTTQADLRNHVVILPFAHFDSYQMILFIGAHSNRHTQQIDEVKANSNYPK